MAAWRYHLKIKDLIQTDEESDEYINKIKVTIAERLEAFSKTVQGYLRKELRDLATNFRDIPEEGGNLDNFNYEMNQLYSLGDSAKIWIE